MIRVIQCGSQKNAKGYYTKGGYYASDRQELPGIWGGNAAERLGLQGNVQKRGFDRVCSNQHPFTGDRLTARMRKDRTPGYDIGFHAPKSISLLYGLTGNPASLDAFRSAYRQAMQAMEAEMQARVRKGGQMANRTAERWGITDPKAKDGLGATTREYKQNAITLPELRNTWRTRLTGDERAILEH